MALGARASRLQSRRFHRLWDHPGSGTTTTASTTRGRRLPSRSSRISTGRRSNWRGRDRGCERTSSGRHHVCVVTTRAVTARIDAHFFLGSELFREHLLFLTVHVHVHAHAHATHAHVTARSLTISPLLARARRRPAMHRGCAAVLSLLACACASDETTPKKACSSSLKGDFQFEACGAFCKQAKSGNHCKFCKCKSCTFCPASSSTTTSAPPVLSPPLRRSAPPPRRS